MTTPTLPTGITVFGTASTVAGPNNAVGSYNVVASATGSSPAFSYALTNAGTCLLKAGQTDAAETALRSALDRSPNNSEALFQMASVLYAKGDYFKARAFVQRFEAVGQPRPESLMLGRNIELRLGNSSAASDYTRRLLQSFPESQQARDLNAQNQS